MSRDSRLNLAASGAGMLVAGALLLALTTWMGTGSLAAFRTIAEERQASDGRVHRKDTTSYGVGWTLLSLAAVSGLLGVGLIWTGGATLWSSLHKSRTDD